MSNGSGQVYIGEVQGIPSHHIPDVRDRHGSPNFGSFQPYSMADGPGGFY